MFSTLEDVAAAIVLVANHGEISQGRLMAEIRERKGTISRHGGEFTCGIHCFSVQGTHEIGYRVSMVFKRPEGWRRCLKVTDESYLTIRRAEELGIPIV